MIYIRGHARDYDMWRQLGLEGWGFSDVLPYFRRSEGNENGDSAFHGGQGPLGVSNPRKTNVLFESFVEAGKQAGHPYTEDFNGPQQEGVGPYQLTIKDGQRCSAAKGYLCSGAEPAEPHRRGRGAYLRASCSMARRPSASSIRRG